MAAEAGGWPFAVLGQVSELDTVVGQHGVDAVWNGCNERFKKGRSGPHVGLFDEFNHGELRGSVDGHEQVELAFGCSDLGRVPVDDQEVVPISERLMGGL